MQLQIAIIKSAQSTHKFEWGEITTGSDLQKASVIPLKITASQEYKVYACSDPQLDILASKATFTFAFAGSGGGKTCLIPLWFFKQIQKKPKGRFLLVSPSVPIFESSELKRHIIDTFQGTALEGSFDSKNRYTLPTGGEIVVKTCGDGSDYQKLTGGQYDGIAADEVYFLSASVWEEMRRRSNIKKAPILCVTTPNANNWIYEIKQEAERGNKDYYVRHWATASNPASNTEHLDREKLLMSKAQFDRMYGGNFASLDGLVYECFGNKGTEPVIDSDPRKGLPSPPVRFFGCCDWGYHPDPFAAYIMAECEDGIVYVLEEIYGTKISPDELGAQLRAMIDKWAIVQDEQYADLVRGGYFTKFWCDASRPELVMHLRRANIPISNRRIADINNGIQRVDAWFRAGRLKIYSTCPNLIRELRGYQWNKSKGGDLKDVPVGRNDHSTDALRYGVSSQKYNEQATPINIIRPTIEAELAKAESFGLLLSQDQVKENQEKRWKEHMESLLWADSD